MVKIATIRFCKLSY